MALHPRAGQLPEPSQLADIPALLDAYREQHPDPADKAQQVSFGTSGHRGRAQERTFNEDHVAAIADAVARHRAQQGIDGPLFLGRDTHALSEPAAQTILEVLSAHGVTVVVDKDDGATPTPVISHAIIAHNKAGDGGTADGIVVTPSHNPPEDGGVKYNPPNGGPADTDITGAIQDEANRLLADGLKSVKRDASPSPELRDYITPYVQDLPSVVDIAAIKQAGLKLGVDPLGGASLYFWEAIGERFGLDLDVVNTQLDPTFSFVPLDGDGKIRMDSSSPHAMARLRDLADRYDVAFANDPDSDRHGIVTPGAGLLNPNHFLAVCIAYLFGGGRDWGAEVGIGKTLVSSSLIDRVADDLGRRLVEVPVGFKWFVPGLIEGWLGFGGEESAGASFLRLDGSAWSTDKDGLIPCLLAAEMTAAGKDPGVRYAELAERLGAPVYTRIDAPAGAKEKDVLKRLSPEQITADEIAGEPITAVLTRAPGNDAPIGGLKVVTGEGWFAARPSGTEDVYKIYAESFQGEEHLERLVSDAKELVDGALAAG